MNLGTGIHESRKSDLRSEGEFLAPKRPGPCAGVSLTDGSWTDPVLSRLNAPRRGTSSIEKQSNPLCPADAAHNPLQRGFRQRTLRGRPERMGLRHLLPLVAALLSALHVLGTQYVVTSYQGPSAYYEYSRDVRYIRCTPSTTLRRPQPTSVQSHVVFWVCVNFHSPFFFYFYAYCSSSVSMIACVTITNSSYRHQLCFDRFHSSNPSSTFSCIAKSILIGM